MPDIYCLFPDGMSIQGISVKEVSVKGVSVQVVSFKGGFLSGGGLCQEEPLDRDLSGRNMRQDTEPNPEGRWDQAVR